MDEKKVVLILVIVIVVLMGLIFLTLSNSYKEVDSQYVYSPVFNENVKFTGTYLGPYDGIYNLDGQSGVIQVGSAYAIVSTDKLQGMEGQTVTVQGHFISDAKETVPINGGYVSGESFLLEEVV